MEPLLDFSNQTALITGAGSGFGQLLAQELAARGCNLALSDIDAKGLAQTLATLASSGVKIEHQVNDIALEQAARELTEMALSINGQLHLAVNNAGIAHHPVALHKISEATLDKQLDVNFKGVMFGMKHQISAMLKQRHGHILNVSSLAGLGGAPRGAAYTAAKHAVAGITRTAALEYGRMNIRVNAICPFYSPTNILNIEGFNTDEARSQLAMGSPMKRLAKPQEVVNTMLLMLSPGNSFMNGQCIALDGGVTAW